MAMAMEGWDFAVSSPRNSFSYDLPQSDLSPATTSGACRTDASLPLHSPSSPSSDFSFSLSNNAVSPHSFSLADDLFSDGILLPLPIKDQPCSSPDKAPLAPPDTGASPTPEPPRRLVSSKKYGGLGNIIASSDKDDDVKSGGTPAQRSFWRFDRSSSLNSNGRRAGLWPFPLSRSKSTGSSLNPTTIGSRDYKHYYSNLRNISSSGRRKGSNSNPSGNNSFLKSSNVDHASTKVYYYSGNSRQNYSAGVRIVPVLNLPTSSSMGIFSFLLCSCKKRT